MFHRDLTQSEVPVSPEHLKETPLERLSKDIPEHLSAQELDQPIAFEVGPCEPLARDMVSPEEFERFKEIYNMLDRMDFSTEYKELLAFRFSEMDVELKDMYNQYADQLVCLDANCKGGTYYSPTAGGFCIDQDADLRSMLGPGSQFFHESGHMIDHLKGKDFGFPTVSARNDMTTAIHKDYEAALAKIQDEYECDSEKAKGILSAELLLHPFASACVSDAFGGITENQVCGVCGHSAEYWKNSPRETPGMEAFASITEIIGSQNAKAYEFTKKYLPNTLTEYNAIVGRLN